MGPTLGSFNQH